MNGLAVWAKRLGRWTVVTAVLLFMLVSLLGIVFFAGVWAFEGSR